MEYLLDYDGIFLRALNRIQGIRPPLEKVTYVQTTQHT